MNSDASIYLIGGGGHALSLMSALPAGVTVAGYVDCKDACLPEVSWMGADDRFLDSVSPSEACVHIAVVAGEGADMSLRSRLITKYSAYKSVSIIAPTAIVVPGSDIAAGCAVMHRAVVNGATIGSHSIINTGAIVEHGCILGGNVFVGPGAVLCGGVHVGSDVFIGAGATIRNGVSICSGAVVAMGAVVTHDIVAPGVYGGVPAHKIY
ncbi:MAG: acetyltransferase [Muribaculaceae bacterium]|nr:acetyltransferase [Muribaculaceae bacterium]